MRCAGTKAVLIFAGAIATGCVDNGSMASMDSVLREMTNGRVRWSSALTINVVD